jgi:hypothetical protein
MTKDIADKEDKPHSERRYLQSPGSVMGLVFRTKKTV